MSEISDSPLWDRSPSGFGMITPEELGLSEHLCQKLRAWNDAANSWPPEGPSPWNKAQWATWHRQGERLARWVRKELPGVEVIMEGDQ